MLLLASVLTFKIRDNIMDVAFKNIKNTNKFNVSKFEDKSIVLFQCIEHTIWKNVLNIVLENN